ncbi:hypothetical protein [Microbacterium testaceum]|uniref:hypothetical protein n=1 Tax=Microbacterium testaceum TaxID=2033 RepID=UPI002435F459|nr:hypothetical protein [Microbacterium testaceum]
MENLTTTPRLLAWADEPASSPWPLPPTGAAWPLDKLDAELIAEVFAARGYTRTPGLPSALARNGAESPAGVLAVLLDELATLIAASFDGYADDLFSFSEELDKVGATPALRASLRATAAAIHAAPEAAAVLAARVAEHLPVDPVLEARELPSAWLALHDADDRIKRPDLVRAYILAGSPGDLSADALRALAARRWGPTRRLRGEDYYRPALAFVVATGPDLERVAALIGVPPEALAELVRTHRT